MPSGKFIAYYRVSTKKQAHADRHGLDAQRNTVYEFLNGGAWELLDEYVEAESGKLGLDRRPQLKAALAAAKAAGATLLIAKLDRLARNVAFIANLMEAGVPFTACDMPEATAFQLHIFAAVAELERKNISSRVRAGMQAAKSKGKTFGTPGNLNRKTQERTAAANAFAANLSGLIEGMRLRGLLQREMVVELNQLGIKAPNGGEWHLTQLQRVIKRLPIATATSAPFVRP